ncbi:DUF6356 family protein [uncultured Litoreibacter sp.]|uniref:DUF6356 family protein n=1 Tax=uncultured Litoreibacter sp. TaxID=1392394 RepID=UPI00260B36F7|nr:DUF6356 family protein [uncultured Litoreibacter sp.]
MSSTTEHTTSKPGFFATFRTHPASVGETYLGHMGFALRFACKLFVAAGAALVHAFIPPLCETTASRKVKELYEMCHHRGAQD